MFDWGGWRHQEREGLLRAEVSIHIEEKLAWPENVSNSCWLALDVMLILIFTLITLISSLFIVMTKEETANQSYLSLNLFLKSFAIIRLLCISQAVWIRSGTLLLVIKYNNNVLVVNSLRIACSHQVPACIECT